MRPTLGNGGPKTRPQLKFAEAGREVSLPELHNVVRSLDQVVEVDYYVPGCPPTPNLTKAAVTALLDGKLPPKGSRPGARHRPVRRVLAQEDQAHEPEHHRVQAPAPVAGGPRALLPGARRRLHGAGDPQRLRRPVHHRQHALHRLLRPHLARPRPGRSRSCPPSAPMSRRRRKDDIDKVLAGIPDPIGTFYRYGLAKSMLRRKVNLPGQLASDAL